MRVALLGSGSAGNAVALTVADGTLVIDAGFGIKSLAARARRAGVELGSVLAVILTHEHGDHSRGAASLAAIARCPVYATAGTLRALEGRLGDAVTHSLPRRGMRAIGAFRVSTAPTAHDAADPVAVRVTSAGGSCIGIAHDVGRPTADVRRLLRRVTCLMLEANHDLGMLRAGPYPPALQARIAGPGGHLSNHDAAELVAALWHPDLEVVVLAHLSERCNRPALAERSVRAALARRRFAGRVIVAPPDASLPPFALGAPQLALDGLG